MVAQVKRAGGPDLAVQVADPLDVEVEVHVVDAAAIAEGGQQFEPGVGRIDVEIHRQAAVLALGRQGRPPQHLHQAHVDAVGVEGPPQQVGVTPGHVDVVGLQPDALLVAQGQLADGQVAPDVAAQALDLQPAKAADLEAIGPGLDHHPRLRQQHAEPGDCQANGDQRQDHQGDGHDRLGDRRALQDLGLLGRGRVVRRAQKLCPMLI